MNCSLRCLRSVFGSKPLALAALAAMVATTTASTSSAGTDKTPPKNAGRSTPDTATPAAPISTTKAVVPDAAEQRMYLERSREEHNARLTWQPLTTMTFDDASLLQRLRVMNGQWEISGGQLLAVGGKADDNRTILLAPVPAGPLRLEFDATLFARPDGRICDICIRLNADPKTGSFTEGYALIAGQYFNQASVCYRLNIPIARTEWSPLIPGQRHRVAVEWTDKHLRFFIDGKIVLDAWDRDKPLLPDPNRWIGLSSYDTRMAIDNLTISTPRPR